MNYSYSKKLENVINTIMQHGLLDQTISNTGFIYRGVKVRPTKSDEKDYVELNIPQHEAVNVYHPNAYESLCKLNKRL